MSPIAKLAGFAGALLLVFGAAALAGGAVDPLREEAGDDRSQTGAMKRARGAQRDRRRSDEGGAVVAGHDHGAGSGAHQHGGGEAAQAVRGLAASSNGLALELERTSAPRGRRFDLGFRITDRSGETVTHFDVTHTKPMHVIVVRRDLSGFQHVHPSQTIDGGWVVQLELQAAGDYRVFADFSYEGRAYTLAGDLTVEGAASYRRVPPPARSVTVDGLRVALKGELSFDVTRNGRPVPVAPYLGARGHLVALREGDLAFLHVHPDADELRFAAQFPSEGRYRLFLQFRAQGGLHTAAFTREVLG